MGRLFSGLFRGPDLKIRMIFALISCEGKTPCNKDKLKILIKIGAIKSEQDFIMLICISSSPGPDIFDVLITSKTSSSAVFSDRSYCHVRIITM